MNRFYFTLFLSIFFACSTSETNELGTDETEILNLILNDFLFNDGICQVSSIDFLLDSTLTYNNHECILGSNERIKRILDWKNAYLVLVKDSTLRIEGAETKKLIKEYFDFEKLKPLPIQPFEYRKGAIFKDVLIQEGMPKLKEYRHVKISDIYLSRDARKAAVCLERPVSCFSLEYTYFLMKIEGKWIVNFKVE